MNLLLTIFQTSFYFLRRYIFLIVKCLITITILFFLYSHFNLHTLKLLENARFVPLVIALFMQYLSLFFSSLRSKLYFKYFDIFLSVRFSFALYCIGTFFNIILPGGISGDLYKIYLLRKTRDLPKLICARILLYERLNGLAALCLLGGLCFLFSDFITLSQYLEYLCYAGLILLIPCYLTAAVLLLKDKPKAIISGFFFSLLIQIFQIVSAIYIMIALGITNNFILMINYIVLFIIASIIAIIPITIGGLGLREVTFVYGTQFLANLNPTIGITIATLSFILYLITGLTGLLFLSKIKKIT